LPSPDQAKNTHLFSQPSHPPVASGT